MFAQATFGVKWGMRGCWGEVNNMVVSDHVAAALMNALLTRAIEPSSTLKRWWRWSTTSTTFNGIMICRQHGTGRGSFGSYIGVGYLHCFRKRLSVFGRCRVYVVRLVVGRFKIARRG